MSFASRSLFVLSFLLAASPAAAQQTPLSPGRPFVASLPETGGGGLELYNGEAGFVFEVPANATEVEVVLNTAPTDAAVDLYARYGADVTIGGDGGILADFRSEAAGGRESIRITSETTPAVRGGLLFIATAAQGPHEPVFIFPEARFETELGSLDVISSDDFESRLQDRWTRNYPAPEPAILGATTGSEEARLRDVVESRSGSRVLELRAEGEDFFVAPADYLGDLSVLGPEARLEFDLAFRGGGPQTGISSEVRLVGESTTFMWRGLPPRQEFQRFVAPLAPGSWDRIGGSATFEQVLAAVQRVEIRGAFGAGEEAVTLLDNVALAGQVDPPVMPVSDNFEEGLADWGRNFAPTPLLVPRIPGVTTGDNRTQLTHFPQGGNPTGYIRISEFEDEGRDFLVAPPRYLGDWAALGRGAQLEFDRRHESASGAFRGVQVRIFGFGAAYSWTGEGPMNQWTRFRVPLDPAVWTLTAGEGTFDDVLSAVQRLEISIDEANGSEVNGFDNALLTAPPQQSPQLTAVPAELTFNASDGGEAPAPIPVELSADGGAVVDWVAETVDGEWIELMTSEGETPATMLVGVNLNGLAPGEYDGMIRLAWSSSTEVLTIPVSLNLAAATAPAISSGGVVNAATFIPNADAGGELAPGMFASIFGIRLASSAAVAEQLPLPRLLNGVSVTFNGAPAPLTYVSENQVNVVVPQALSGSSAAVVVRRDGEASSTETVRLTPIRPLIFLVDGRAAALNLGDDGAALNGPETPAQPGQTITIFGTGFGPTENPLPDGVAATGENRIFGSAEVLVGGREAEVSYAGLSPGSAHLYQINAELHPETPVGCDVPLTLRIDGVEGNEAPLAVTADGSACQ